MADTARLTTALAGRYAIERELGAGGMATVYLARDLKHDRAVALKVLRPELAAVLGGERFLNEIKISARLDHPHILTLIDSGEVDGFLYYVLPYVRGESLRERLTREKQLGLEEALGITKQVAGALDYAHRQGVVHRDIKPENILLQEGEAMLADFGIALAVKEAGGNRLTETGLSLGTPQYMSPEQATGDRQLDARGDVYSLAAVLYEMLAGEPPHSGPTAQAIIAKLTRRGHCASSPTTSGTTGARPGRPTATGWYSIPTGADRRTCGWWRPRVGPPVASRQTWRSRATLPGRPMDRESCTRRRVPASRSM
jgi:serine/threonine-protein kinase